MKLIKVKQFKLSAIEGTAIFKNGRLIGALGKKVKRHAKNL